MASFLCPGITTIPSLAGNVSGMNLQALCSYVLDQVQVYEFNRPFQLLQNVKNKINYYQKTSKYMQLKAGRGKSYPRTAIVILSEL